MMPKNVRLLLAAALLGSAAPAQAAEFKSLAYPYTLIVPDDWQSKKVDGVDVALAAPSTGGLVPASLNVSATPVPADLKVTLDDLRALMLKQAGEAVTNFKLIGDTSLTVGGLPGRELSYSGLQQSVPMRWVQRVTLRNNVAYILTFGASQSAFDKNQAAGLAVLDSFKLSAK